MAMALVAKHEYMEWDGMGGTTLMIVNDAL